MTATHVAGSFRDPAGFVFERDGILYRQVNVVHRPHYDALRASGLYEALVERDLLIPHEEVDVEPADPSTASLVIRPERVGFISHPYEWSPGQLRAAALATLEAQRLAMDREMSLRDASAYNVQFHRGRPVLIDTLSFETLPEGRPWVAYRQFCQHFLAPLALAANVDVRLLQLARVHIDGIPLDLASSLLPARTRLQPGLAMHVHAHAASQRRHADKPAAADATREFSRNAFTGLVQSLFKAVVKQRWEPPPSAWRDYYAATQSYSDESLRHKEQLVEAALGRLSPSTVWDLGANTGRFSRIAAAAGADVVSIEMDPSAVEMSWHQVEAEAETSILPLLVDLTNPPPAQGWAHSERPSLGDRGPADVALALALIHHLAIGNNVPLPEVVAWLATVARCVIVEWIPKDDPMVQRLLASREDIFAGYHQEGFEQAAQRHFDVDSREAVAGSVRWLYVLRRKDA